MDRTYPTAEFEAVVGPDRTVVIPRALGERWKPGMRVTLRMTAGGIDAGLKMRHVTEDEIESIATLQLEQRENVIEFLRSEGALRNRTLFRRRAMRLLRGRR